MLENLQLFWDFFFYPFYYIDQLGIISDVLVLCFVVFAIFEFVLWCIEWSMSLTMK